MDQQKSLRHTDYFRISKRIRHQTDWADHTPLNFPEEGADLYYLSYSSANYHYLLGQRHYRCAEHGLSFAVDANAETPSDNQIVENIHFKYPLLRERGSISSLPRHTRVTLLLHGLNERSFGKYLPWAYHLWGQGGAPVLLFPLTFHVNRVLPAWGQQQLDSFKRRQQIADNENVHRFNAVISERLDAYPERFFWGAIQSYWDLIDLARQIRGGLHPHIAPEARLDFVGYSAGGFLALLLLLENHEDLFANSRACLFSTCAAIRDLNLSSPFIVDGEAENTLMKLYVRHLERSAGERMRHWLEHHGEGQWARAFSGLLPDRSRLNARLSELAPRLLGFANPNDRVIPQGAMLNSLQGVLRDTGVRVEELSLGVHENPFSCANYQQKERKFLTDFLDQELFGEAFRVFIERICAHLQ
jgi:pimeloyl-ACP methyl ester carboxylesterase